jgi:exportin-1
VHSHAGGSVWGIQVPRIFVAVFECTLEMITRNFEDFPEHRINFFKLLRAINSHCFDVRRT